ncbi:MAG: hypothetical protein R3202_08335, partial [Candidatus Competibacterales bacterium]|nr:hypothetical protein [Candidatus Competibacterales bacterium]
QIAPLDGKTVRLPVPEFRWAEVEQAVAYRFQLGPEPGFNVPAIDRTDLAATTLTPESLEPGDYHWRVASIAADGEQGPYGDVIAFSLRPTPDPEPPEVGEQTLGFRLPEGLPGERYRFQLARDRGFDTLLHDRTLDAPRVDIDRPPGGSTYYMRYAIIGTDGEQGPYSGTQSLWVPIEDYRPLIFFFGTAILLLAL